MLSDLTGFVALCVIMWVSLLEGAMQSARGSPSLPLLFDLGSISVPQMLHPFWICFLAMVLGFIGIAVLRTWTWQCDLQVLSCNGSLWPPVEMENAAWVVLDTCWFLRVSAAKVLEFMVLLRIKASNYRLSHFFRPWEFSMTKFWVLTWPYLVLFIL